MGSIALYIYHGKKGWDVSELVVGVISKLGGNPIFIYDCIRIIIYDRQ